LANSSESTQSHTAFVAGIKPAPAQVKVLNGFNDVVDNLVFISYELFILFYYSQVLGLSGTLAGAAILISMVIDALTDPIVGTWSDNLRSRFGRRHAFMFGSIIPIGLSFYLLFAPPQGLDGTGLFLWLTAMSVAVRVTLTFFSAPAKAVVAEISPLKGDRAEMGIYGQIAGALGRFGLLWLAFSVFFRSTPEFANGQENQAAYPEFALAMSAVVMICMAIGSAATFSRIQEFESRLGPPSGARFNLRSALRDWLRALVEVPNFRAIFIGLFFATCMGSTYRATSIYLGTYMFEFTPEQIGVWQQIVLIGVFAMAIIFRFIIPHVDPKTPYVSAFAMIMLSMGMPPLLFAMGALPPAGDPALLYIMYGFNALMGAASGVIMICSAVMFSETTDEYHFITRISQTGMIFGLITFGNKTASGLGKVIAGGLLDVVNFPGKENIEQLTPETLSSLAVLLAAVVFTAGVVGFLILNTYKLDRKRHAEVLAGIDRMATG
jgi:GPH family glycoside/pentoside/hexuronide:cation symporter